MCFPIRRSPVPHQRSTVAASLKPSLPQTRSRVSAPCREAFEQQPHWAFGSIKASLSGVEPLMESIQDDIRKVDDEVLAAVRQQSNSGTKAGEELASATTAVN